MGNGAFAVAHEMPRDLHEPSGRFAGSSVVVGTLRFAHPTSSAAPGRPWHEQFMKFFGNICKTNK